MVNITGLDRASVIQSLYESARVQGMGFLQTTNGPLPRDEAEQLVGRCIDYLHGRVMKIRITVDSDSFEERLFDRDNGSGAAEQAVRRVRMAAEARTANATG